MGVLRAAGPAPGLAAAEGLRRRPEPAARARGAIRAHAACLLRLLLLCLLRDQRRRRRCVPVQRGPIIAGGRAFSSTRDGTKSALIEMCIGVARTDTQHGATTVPGR